VWNNNNNRFLGNLSIDKKCQPSIDLLSMRTLAMRRMQRFSSQSPHRNACSWTTLPSLSQPRKIPFSFLGYLIILLFFTGHDHGLVAGKQGAVFGFVSELPDPLLHFCLGELIAFSGMYGMEDVPNWDEYTLNITDEGPTASWISSPMSSMEARGRIDYEKNTYDCIELRIN